MSTSSTPESAAADKAAPPPHHQQYDDASHKIFVSRVPHNFDESSVQRLLQDRLGADAVLHVALAYEKDADDGEMIKEGKEAEPPTSKEEDDRFYRPRKKAKNATTAEVLLHNKDNEEDAPKQHRGFGFATLATVELVRKAIHEIQTVRGGAKPTSTRKHTLYIGPCLNDRDEKKKQAGDDLVANAGSENPKKQPCFLFAKQGRCPYGANCKFSHDGPPAKIAKNDKATDDSSKKKKKCRDHRKNKCKLGEACPYSHDFEPTVKSKPSLQQRPDSEKDCINWKSKGKCNRLEKGACPYRHDPAVRQAALAKKEQRKSNKTGPNDNGATAGNKLGGGNTKKRQQPLTVRVFGLNYETKEADVRDLFRACGPIVAVEFPTFGDSHGERSKGYCGVTFQSPRAVEKAIELSGTELHGRWLEVQAGRMLLEHWEQQQQPEKQPPHQQRSNTTK